MKISALKEKVHQLWKALHKVKRALPPAQDGAFKAEMKSVSGGDLRRKDTWQSLFAIFTAKFLWETNGDNQFLIEFHLIQCSQKEGWTDLLPYVLQQFIAIDGGYECLMNGLYSIQQYGPGYGSDLADLKELASATQRIGQQQRRPDEIRSRSALTALPAAS